MKRSMQISLDGVRPHPMRRLPHDLDDEIAVVSRRQFPNRTIAAAMALLTESHVLARDACRDVWDFAVEISELERLGASRSGLRWLVSQRLACHGYETTASSCGSPRSFAATPATAQFTSRSCFVLSELGRTLLGGQCKSAGGANGLESTILSFAALRESQRRGVSGGDLPQFDAAVSELTVGGRVVKRFCRPAPNQRAILRAFEELSWPRHLDDPIPPSGDVCAKRRLNETIRALNAHQIHKLLRFSGDGSGAGILWNFVGDAGEAGSGVVPKDS